jgi:transposase
MRLVDDPDERFEYPPAECRGCGAGLGGEPVAAQRRHQVTDIEPAPAPKVTGYVAQAKQCPCCATVTEGVLPAHVRARASYGVEASGFMERVRELLKSAPAVHADEIPARADGGMRYVHLACTAYPTHMHTGDRSAPAIDAGGVLPGYQGVIVRDGYVGYSHLTGALHAWCGAHLLRDLTDLYDFEPGKQDWASKMAILLIEARDAARDARQDGKAALDAAVLEDLVARYRELAAAGLAASIYRRTATARDARRIARRFLHFEDMILRFATRPDLDIFTKTSR